jgi:type IV pilus assembly protein PilW
MNSAKSRSMTPRRQAGFTLIELMVGVTVGLIATIVMFQVFAVSEGQKRTTTGSGDAQQNGSTSLFQIERVARMAGFGVNDKQLLGCQVNGFNEDTNATFNFVLAPVLITNGAAGAPDQLAFLFGNSNAFIAPEGLSQDMANAGAPFRVLNRFGFRPGDVLIAGETGKPCSMTQVLSLPGTPNESFINHDPGNYVDAQGVARTTKYNRVGGLPPPNDVIYTEFKRPSTGGRLFNLGQLPTSTVYSIVNSQLVQDDGLGSGQTVVVSDAIVQMQAQYGFDANNDGFINPAAVTVAVINPGLASDQWADSMPAGASAATWSQVVAVRLAVVARSMQPEKPPNPGDPCNATTALPRWIGGAPGASPAGVDVDITADPNWMCYRYRVFDVTVPLRNLMWFPDPNA